MEVPRINILIANKVLVISERSNDKWYDDKYKTIINFIDESNSPEYYYDNYLRVLNNYDINEVERRYHEFKRNYKYIDYVRKIIKNLEAIIH